MTKRRFEIKERGNKRRRKKPVYLIIAEGRNKTEKLYFSNFQCQDKTYSIRFINAGSNTDAESLYMKMVSKWNELELEENIGDKGFIVLDIDNDGCKAIKVYELIQNNKYPSIRFIVSNPTFEVWFLLHFKYTTKHFSDGDAVIKELEKYIPNYNKGKDYYSVLEGKMQKAIDNSNMLNKNYEELRWPSIKCNPRTDVGGLFEIL